MVRLILFYQRWISPLLPPRCRFYPSCSEYALTAIELHGGLKGSLLATKRICRCHPLCEGGYDPVPGSEHEPKDDTNTLTGGTGTGGDKHWRDVPPRAVTGNPKS